MGFRSATLCLKGTEGALTYEKRNGVFTLPFSVGDLHVGAFPEGGFRCASSGAFRTENLFVICAQLIGESVGSITFELSFKEAHVTLLMHKMEETMFREYNGIVSGSAADAHAPSLS